jgi:hypothetical protein
MQPGYTNGVQNQKASGPLAPDRGFRVNRLSARLDVTLGSALVICVIQNDMKRSDLPA